MSIKDDDNSSLYLSLKDFWFKEEKYISLKAHLEISYSHINQ